MHAFLPHDSAEERQLSFLFPVYGSGRAATAFIIFDKEASMTKSSLPCFADNAGRKEIAVRVRKFMCAGAPAPFDHPHIVLNMGEDDKILCPYCSTLYRFAATLPEQQDQTAESSCR